MSYSFPPCSIDLTQHSKDIELSVCLQWIFYIRLGGLPYHWRLPFLGCFRKLCNNLQNVVAITYIFALQQPTFLVCNFLHFYFTINIMNRPFPVLLQGQIQPLIFLFLWMLLIAYVPYYIPSSSVSSSISMSDWLSFSSLSISMDIALISFSFMPKELKITFWRFETAWSNR